MVIPVTLWGNLDRDRTSLQVTQVFSGKVQDQKNWPHRCSEGALQPHQATQKYLNLGFHNTQEHQSISWLFFPEARNRYRNQLKGNHYCHTTEVVDCVSAPHGARSHLAEVSPRGAESLGEKRTEMESTRLTQP